MIVPKVLIVLGIGLFAVTLVAVIASIVSGDLFYSEAAVDIEPDEGDPPLETVEFR